MLGARRGPAQGRLPGASRTADMRPSEDDEGSRAIRCVIGDLKLIAHPFEKLFSGIIRSAKIAWVLSARGSDNRA